MKKAILSCVMVFATGLMLTNVAIAEDVPVVKVLHYQGSGDMASIGVLVASMLGARCYSAVVPQTQVQLNVMPRDLTCPAQNEYAVFVSDLPGTENWRYQAQVRAGGTCIAMHNKEGILLPEARISLSCEDPMAP